MPKLIGIAGKAGSGKDTMADFLWERHGVTKIAFADPLKKAAEHIFGIPSKTFHDRKLKEEHNEYWGMSPRRMLQLLGTEATKSHFGEDVWIKRWLLTFTGIRRTDSVVVPDVRFEPEAAMIRRLGGIVVHLHRDEAGLNGDHGTHASEAGLVRQPFDVVIMNNGSFDDLATLTDMVFRAAGNTHEA